MSVNASSDEDECKSESSVNTSSRSLSAMKRSRMAVSRLVDDTVTGSIEGEVEIGAGNDRDDCE